MLLNVIGILVIIVLVILIIGMIIYMISCSKETKNVYQYLKKKRQEAMLPDEDDD